MKTSQVAASRSRSCSFQPFCTPSQISAACHLPLSVRLADTGSGLPALGNTSMTQHLSMPILVRLHFASASSFDQKKETLRKRSANGRPGESYLSKAAAEVKGQTFLPTLPSIGVALWALDRVDQKLTV